MTAPVVPAKRERLNRDRVLDAAVRLADEIGADALSMRRLAHELGVVPMALYKHVADKEDLLDGMVEVIVREIDPLITGADWKTTIRERVLAARRTFQRHRWARQALETRTRQTPAVLDYMDSFIGTFLAGGFSVDLTHHVMHAIGGRMWGFTQELFDRSGAPDDAASADPDGADSASADAAPQMPAAMLAQMAERYPNIVAVATSTPHDESTVVGHGCDDEFEFRFALDLMLDGIERLHRSGWNSVDARLAPSPAAEDP
jgi:AcrR family transcriptional regulator